MYQDSILYDDQTMMAKATAAKKQDVYTGGRRLRFLSYNIQTGTTTSSYRHFLTQSWRHVLRCLRVRSAR